MAKITGVETLYTNGNGLMISCKMLPWRCTHTIFMKYDVTVEFSTKSITGKLGTTNH